VPPEHGRTSRPWHPTLFETALEPQKNYGGKARLGPQSQLIQNCL
jgi:hypothetical protein